MSKMGSFVFDIQELVSEMIARGEKREIILLTVEKCYGTMGLDCAMEYLLTVEGE
jgi:hypothetical protein